MRPTPPISPHLLLLRALDDELFGGYNSEQHTLGAWARDVVCYMQQACPDQTMEEKVVLAVATSAFKDIMHSENWQFLLEDAVQRPWAFARTLLIMLNGRIMSARPQGNISSLLH